MVLFSKPWPCSLPLLFALLFAFFKAAACLSCHSLQPHASSLRAPSPRRHFPQVYFPFPRLFFLLQWYLSLPANFPTWHSRQQILACLLLAQTSPLNLFFFKEGSEASSCTKAVLTGFGCSPPVSLACTKPFTRSWHCKNAFRAWGRLPGDVLICTLKDFTTVFLF